MAPEASRFIRRLAALTRLSMDITRSVGSFKKCAWDGGEGMVRPYIQCSVSFNLIQDKKSFCVVLVACVLL